MGRGARHYGGQSALTAGEVAEGVLSRLDRWTDRAMPRWRTVALDGGEIHHDAITENPQTSV